MGLVNLFLLELSENKIKNLENNSFVGLVNLNYLILDYNQISSIHNNLFKSLINLDIMSIIGNKLKKITNYMLNGLIKLTILYLNENKLTQIENNSFSELINIKELYIQDNRIIELDFNIFKNNKNLKEIYASHNKLRSLIGNISFISSLRVVYLNNNSISSIDASGLSEYLFANKSIYLENNRVDMIINCSYKFILENIYKRSFNFYSGNTNIKWLFISGYDINNLNLNSFKADCLFQYFDNQYSCKKEKIKFENYLLTCKKGNLLYL